MMMMAMKSGATVVVEDSLLVAEAPIDVVFEATGHAEAAAMTIDAAHQQGRHTVIVTKEAESIVGPAAEDGGCSRGSRTYYC